MKNKATKKAKIPGGKKLLERAGLAVKHEFYLEATWIISSMMDKKLGRILVKMQIQEPRGGLTFVQRIKRVKTMASGAGGAGLPESLNTGLIDGIRNWKNQRNEVMRDLPEIHVSKARLERLANEGVRLFKELNKGVKSLKTADG